jgi:hypothetical protein
MEGGHVKLKDRTYTKTGIDWDNFFDDCGVYGIRSLPKIMRSAVYSAAKNRGYKCETQDFGGSNMYYKLTRDEPRDRILKAFSKLQDQQLTALYKAAVKSKIIINNEGGVE